MIQMSNGVMILMMTMNKQNKNQAKRQNRKEKNTMKQNNKNFQHWKKYKQ